MISIPGYILTKKIWESAHSEIYRGIREVDKQKIIIKLLSDQHPSLVDIAQFEREYELLKQLDGNGTINVLALEKSHELAIIEEDGGETLHAVLQQRSLTIKEFLTQALQIIDALEKIHQQNIIHKDINPANILFNPNTQQIKIIDFGLATTLSRQVAEVHNAEQMQAGTLPYISPEQTGRMNRGMDYRTDYYSLGVTFYQMITGMLPFQSKDMAELIHAHIAKLPIPPHEINPKVPIVLSDIILKLMAKRAEDRYQSTFGLKTDLQNCLHQLMKNNVIEEFKIAQNDFSVRFHIPEKLYGREEQLEQLMHAFDEVVTGKTKFILVAGYSGIGKTSLVNELHKPLVEKHGYFITGKYEQYKKNTPYTAIIQAIEELIQQILTESEENLNSWRDRILKAITPNGRVVTDLIPQLTTIIGEQPPIADLEAIERESRFNFVFINLIQALTSPDHPLVIFLDDCQWIDLSSLNILLSLLLNANSRHLMIILAYRENEIDKSHILTLSLSELEKSGFTFNTLKVPPLSPRYVAEIIADTLHQPVAAVTPLAEICYEKTQGNPFFLNQFLQTLYSEKLIEFNFEQGHWYWSSQNIKQKNITHNVVELMTQNIKKLTPTSQQVLALAACLGNKFDLNTLSLVSNIPSESIFKDLSEAIQAGFITPIHDMYQFLHDRIQQAARSLITGAELIKIHLNIGRVLLHNTSDEKKSETIFIIIDHLNLGIPLITEADEKIQLAKLNLQAGLKAKDSAAFKAAFDYFKLGIDLLGETSWQTHYELTKTLYAEVVETAYLANNQAVDQLSETALSHTKELLDRVKLYRIKQRYLLSQHKITESMKVGLYSLQLLGLPFKEHPNNFQIIISLLKTKWCLRNKSMDDLFHLPEMTDPFIKEAIPILQSTATSASVSDPKLTAMIILKSVQLYVKYGNSRTYPGFYCYYALILGEALKQYTLGYQFSQLSIRLVEHFQAHKEASYIWMMSALTLPWKERVENVLPLLIKAYQKGLETGSIEGIVYSSMAYAAYAFNYGIELNRLIQELQEMQQNNRAFQSHITERYYANILLQTLLNLAGRSEDPTRLQGIACDEDEMFQRFNTAGDDTGRLIIYRCKIMLGFLFDDLPLAYAMGKEMISFQHLDQVIYSLSCVYIYYVCASLAYFNQVSKKEQKQILKNVKSIQHNLKIWSDMAPMNFLNKYYLINAELAKFHHDISTAELLYDKAIALAKEQHFITEEALANELTALFYLSRNKDKIAKIYIQEAHYCYNKWGAIAKVKQLEKKYPHFLRDKQSSKRSFETSFSTSHHTTDMTNMFDLSSIMKATQTITREIDLEKLLKKMMCIVIENAGAEKGYFLLEKSGHWYIEAEASVGHQEVNVMQSIPIRNMIPVSLMHYVIRNKQPIALGNAILSEQFSHDAYIKRVQPKSVLCMPLLNQGVLSSILYLENNLATDAFTKERIEILNILSGQIVSAIDNAKLYTHLKELNRVQSSFVPKELLNLLGKNSITEVKLGDQVQKEMTVMFCDIRNFTSISEKLSAKKTMTFINRFFSKMEPVITQHRGLIDKYIGDAIMALYPDNADDAVLGSIAMLKALRRYNKMRLKKFQTADPIQIGIGLNSGLLVLGTVGTAYRMEGTVLSDTVNIASRTETLTKTYHAPLLITEDTYHKLRDPKRYSIRKIDNSVIVKGKTIPIVIYEVFDHEPKRVIQAKQQTLLQFEQGIDLFWHKDYQPALTIFQEISQQNPTDLPAKLYIERCKNKLITN